MIGDKNESFPKDLPAFLPISDYGFEIDHLQYGRIYSRENAAALVTLPEPSGPWYFFCQHYYCLTSAIFLIYNDKLGKIGVRNCMIWPARQSRIR